MNIQKNDKNDKNNDTDLARQVRALVDQVNMLRRDLAALEQRVAKVEVREEFVEAPDAAGDEPVAR